MMKTIRDTQAVPEPSDSSLISEYLSPGSTILAGFLRENFCGFWWLFELPPRKAVERQVAAENPSGKRSTQS